MELKKLENVTIWILCGVALLLVAACWWLAESLTAPDYERIESDVRFPYSYDKEDGDLVDSYFELAWSHREYSPVLVVHDFTNGETMKLKDEFTSKYKEQVTPSSFQGWWRHIFWWWFITFVIILIYVLIPLGEKVKYKILFLRIKKNPSFENCLYVLSKNKYPYDEEVRKLQSQLVWQYIKKNQTKLEAKFKESFVPAIPELLRLVLAQGSNNVKYQYSLNNDLRPQIEFLSGIEAELRSKLDADPIAQDFINDIETLKQNKYISYPNLGSAINYSSIVNAQLRLLFKEILETDVFNFEAFTANQSKKTINSSILFVSTQLINSLKTYSCAGLKDNCRFAGIDVIFSIYTYENRERKILWQNNLRSECSYQVRKNFSFSEASLYLNMVSTTIGTFTKNLMKTK